MREDEFGNVKWRMRIAYKILVVSLDGPSHLKNVHKWKNETEVDFKKQNARLWSGFSWLKIGSRQDDVVTVMRDEM